MVVETDKITDEKDKLFMGLAHHLWKSLFVGTVVAFILNNTAGFLMLYNFTVPFGLIVWVTDVAIFVPLMILAIVGMKNTGKSLLKIQVFRVIFWSAVFYFGILWALQSWIKGRP